MKSLILLSRSSAGLKRSLAACAGGLVVYAVAVFCIVAGVALQALAVLS